MSDSPHLAALRGACALALRGLMLVVPPRRQVFVAAFPPDEGNAVEVVRSLIERYQGRIIWADAPPPSRLAALRVDATRVHRTKKRSLRAILAFARSEAVFSTHGVYGCPDPVRGKAMVNLWHGDGPKGHAGTPVPSTFLVSGSGVFGRRLAASFGVATRDLLLTGQPRLSQFAAPTDAASLESLGVDGTRPFVVWMPTVRQLAAAGRNASRSDTTDPQADLTLADLIEPGLQVLASLGVSLVVKVHPIDRVPRSHTGLITVSDRDLVAAGTTLYSFLAASAGLVTDYSSVWTDYLALDRPIGFFLPDLEAYAHGRGVMEGWLEVLPGPTLRSPDDFESFGREVLGHADPAAAQMRRHALEVFEIVHRDRPADDLLDELSRRGALAVGARAPETDRRAV